MRGNDREVLRGGNAYQVHVWGVGQNRVVDNVYLYGFVYRSDLRGSESVQQVAQVGGYTT
jgi:hypothetical protein